MKDRKAHLAEIEENARQRGFALVTAQRPILDQHVHNGQIPLDINEALVAENVANFERLCAEMRAAGATGKEMKRFTRGLHAGMRAGAADNFKPHLEATANAGI